MTVLISGQLFHELRLLVEFSKISFTLIHVCCLGNVLVLSTVNSGLVLIWLQKNAPDYVKVGIYYLLLRSFRIESSLGAH